MRLKSFRMPAFGLAMALFAGVAVGAAQASPLASAAMIAPVAAGSDDLHIVQHHYSRGPRHRHHGHRHGYYRSYRDDGVAAGLAAGAIGALALGGLAASGAFDPAPQGYAPMAPARRQWCARQYRSYNPADGTFIGRDGRLRFCG